MLHALRDWSRRRFLKLTVAHLHHGIRGAAADRDAEFVQQLAWSLGLPCIVGFEDVPARAKASGESIEMAARAARLEFFARVCEQTNATALALAHTADDSAETLLLRLLRGGGMQSLGGISPIARVGSLRIVRPMIDVTRAQVEAFLRRHSLRWREDRTNRDERILRNRVRHELIPLLESQYQPGIRHVLARTAERIREDALLLEPLIKRAERKAAIGDDLAADALRKMPPALCRHVIVRWLRRCGAPESCIDADFLMLTQNLLAGRKGRIQVQPGFFIEMRSSRLVFARERTLTRAPRARSLKIPGQVRWIMGRVVSAQHCTGILKPPRGRIGDVPCEVTIRPPREGERLTVRAVWPGARFAPIGFRGTMKMQDLFVNERVPRERRLEIPLVTCGNEVIWVPGHRIARNWSVASESAPSVLLRFS
jgi:tRNA(Ile)-lysidine synthase